MWTSPKAFSFVKTFPSRSATLGHLSVGNIRNCLFYTTSSYFRAVIGQYFPSCPSASLSKTLPIHPRSFHPQLLSLPGVATLNTSVPGYRVGKVILQQGPVGVIEASTPDILTG